MRLRSLGIIAGLLGTMFLAACSPSKIEAGNVGVKFNNLGSDKGVQEEVVGPGWYLLTWNENMYKFPTFTQNHTWTGKQGSEGYEGAFTFQSREGMRMSSDIGVSYAIDPTKVSLIFQKYRRGIEEITDIYIRNMIRDALVAETSKRTIDKVYGEEKESLLLAVQDRVKSQVAPIGINIEKIYWIGQIDLPPSIVTAINNKTEAAQTTVRLEEEVNQRKAEADKKIEDARGEAKAIELKSIAQAEANERLSRSLTPELVKYESILKWNGVTPMFTGGATPFVDVSKMLNN